jgi:hypothetical protein
MADAAQSPPSSAMPRRWYRLHFSTWILVCLGALAIALLLVPGEEGYYPNQRAADPDQAIVHGWPFTYLWRTIGNSIFFGDANAKAPFVWKLFDGVKEFRPAILFADVVLLVTCFGIGATAWEWRRRSRPFRFQFRLRTLFVAVTLFAALLGWWTIERRADRELMEHLQAIETGRLSVPTAKLRVPRFPLWIRAVIGDERLKQTGITRLHSGLAAVWTPATREHIKYLVGRSASDVWVEIKTAPTDDELARFIELIPLENLVIHDAPSRLVCRISGLPALRRLYIGAHHGGAIDDAGLKCLAIMPLLCVLEIVDGHRITEGSLAELAARSNLEFLSIWRAKLTAKGCASISAMHELRILWLWLAPITDKVIEPLAGNNRIERLSFPATMVTDDVLKIVQSMRGLKWVSLSGAAVTDAGVAELKKNRPDLQVFSDSEADAFSYLKASIDEVNAGTTTRLAVGGSVSDGHLSELGTLTKVDSLALGGRYLTDAALERAKTLTGLKELDISGSQMTGKGLQHLLKLPNLTTLTLDEKQLDDDAIATIKKLPALKHIHVKLGLEPADSLKLKDKAVKALPGYDLHFDEPQGKIDPWE